MPRLIAILLTSVICVLPLTSLAEEQPSLISIAELYKNRAELDGKQVRIRGKVVKVNNRIMNRNFLHLQDGSGDPADGSNDVTITSQDTASMGDEVTVTGSVVLDHDFGAGYRYPLLIEKASIAPGN